MKPSRPTASRTLRRWLDAIAMDTHAFAVVEGAAVKPSKNWQAWDETVSVLPKGSRKPVRLLVDSKLRLHPQHALAAVEQAKTYRLDADPSAVPVVAAPFISDRAASICREHGLGYFDGAGMVRYKRAAMYVEESRSRDVLADLLKDLDLKEVDSGPSAVLWLTDDESVFYNSGERGGLSTVSSLQVYLDLLQNPARGEEAAAELLRRTILPRFNSGSTT